MIMYFLKALEHGLCALTKVFTVMIELQKYCTLKCANIYNPKERI